MPNDSGYGSLLQCICFSSRSPMIHERVEADEFAAQFIDRLAVSMTSLSIPFHIRPLEFQPYKFHGCDSARHNDLKYSGLLWLRSKGFADAELEGACDYGSADVISKAGKITIECGNTPISRLRAMVTSPEPSMLVLPLWCVSQGMATGFLFFTARIHAEIMGWIDEVAFAERVLEISGRLNFTKFLEAPDA